MRSRALVAAALAATLAACAARTMPPMPAAPAHPEYPYPAVASGAAPDQVARIERGWRYLQADNLRAAEREFQAAARAQAGFAPAEAALGFVELARRDAEDAVARFDRALAADGAYVPALVGRGQALLELNRDGEALASFEAALASDATLVEVAARVEVLRFRALQDNLARAKAAAAAGEWAEARAAYERAIAASPESGFLYRELALVERRAGETALALDHLRTAVSLDPGDAAAHAQIGAILDAQGDYAGALAAWETALAIDRTAVEEAAVRRARERLALAALPAEYRRISTSATVTRGDVAALVGVRLEGLLAGARQRQVVLTDIRGHWAAPWIAAAVRAGAMEPLPNYTFAPREIVRRAEMAQTVARVLNLIAASKPALGRAWQGARVTVADVPPGHLLHPAVSLAVASGVMPLEAGGRFNLLEAVSGAEATAIIGRLEALARP
ncbi:MAG: S-layer homology domain-containing protein [Acidobacteriota bacterium]